MGKRLNVNEVKRLAIGQKVSEDIVRVFGRDILPVGVISGRSERAVTLDEPRQGSCVREVTKAGRRTTTVFGNLRSLSGISI